MSRKIRILWIDDEADLLNLHIIFLQRKGHEVYTATNAYDAFDLLREKKFDIIFLDHNMPGMSGIESLPRLRELAPETPIIMITKSEDEPLMDEAIGLKVDDYLIKPVKPQQILLVIKKNVYQRDLVTNQISIRFREQFNQISEKISHAWHWNNWIDIYKDLTLWDIVLEEINDSMIWEIFDLLKVEANRQFSRFVRKNYFDWINGEDRPLMIYEVLKDRVFPYLKEKKPVFLLVIDNLRFDHWREFRNIFGDYFDIEYESLIFSILPTATQYARNALFAGLLPLQIKKYYPQYWVDEDEPGKKNENEYELLMKNLERLGMKKKVFYTKIFTDKQNEKILSQVKLLLNNDLNVLVYNFVDMISHAKTNVNMIKELARDEKAYRDLTRSWLENSSIVNLLKELSEHDIRLFVTTDHGCIRVKNPIKVVGDRETTTNIRYKQGKELKFPKNKVFYVANPEVIGIPKTNIVNSYIFALEDYYFVYPKNYHQFVNLYKDTFQHGGISMEEMMIPFVELKSKKV